ncbi:hypothetical protein [Kosakonia cowanii]|uniref:hypothetical protein n=1 Tax=Kosakonia cowanii TaxID=208223 RepID=UPI0028A00178|nr:hypothetical protein [Kosakonia cowanii]
MQMAGVHICQTYTHFCLFSAEIRKKLVPDLPVTATKILVKRFQKMSYTPVAQGLRGVLRARTLPLRHRDLCRIVYSVRVLPFRKSRNSQKIGSHRNGHPVIYLCGYVAAYYQVGDDCVREK